jgi:hypothetical protein
MKPPKISVTRFKNPNRSPRTRIVCGCGCKSRLDIFHDKDGMEIGGVNGSRAFWRELFSKKLA